MCPDEIELWVEAINARDEIIFQEKMQVDPLTNRHDKPAIDARRIALRSSKYRWHDFLRLPVDLRSNK